MYKDTCQYDRPPPLSQIVDLAQRLQDAEQTIALMKQQMEGGANHPTSTAPATSPPEQAHDDYVAAPPTQTQQRETHVDDAGLPDMWAPDGERRRPGFQTPVEMEEHLMEADLSVDANGQVSLATDLTDDKALISWTDILDSSAAARLCVLVPGREGPAASYERKCETDVDSECTRISGVGGLCHWQRCVEEQYARRFDASAPQAALDLDRPAVLLGT